MRCRSFCFLRCRCVSTTNRTKRITPPINRMIMLGLFCHSILTNSEKSEFIVNSTLFSEKPKRAGGLMAIRRATCRRVSPLPTRHNHKIKIRACVCRHLAAVNLVNGKICKASPAQKPATRDTARGTFSVEISRHIRPRTAQSRLGLAQFPNAFTRRGGLLRFQTGQPRHRTGAGQRAVHGIVVETIEPPRPAARRRNQSHARGDAAPAI